MIGSYEQLPAHTLTAEEISSSDKVLQKPIRRFNHQLSALRQQTIADFLQPDDVARMTDLEKAEEAVSHKVNELKQAAVYFDQVYRKERLQVGWKTDAVVTNLYYERLKYRLLGIGDELETKRIARERGDLNQYLLVVRRLLSALSHLGDPKSLQDYSDVHLIAEIDGVDYEKRVMYNFVKPLYYGNTNAGVEVVYPPLKFAFNALLVMNRVEFRVFVQERMGLDISSQAVQAVERVLFGQTPQTFREKLALAVAQYGWQKGLWQTVMQRKKEAAKAKRSILEEANTDALPAELREFLGRLEIINQAGQYQPEVMAALMAQLEALEADQEVRLSQLLPPQERLRSKDE